VSDYTGILIEPQLATDTVKALARRQTFFMWFGGLWAILGVFAIIGLASKNPWKNGTEASGGLVAVGLMLGLGGRAWWRNRRRLATTQRALLFLSQHCQAGLRMNTLTVQLEQLTIDMPLPDKAAAALAQRAQQQRLYR
jgi:hypothetical protein